MYNVLIVDDEEVIRKGLAAALDWQAHGFQVSAALSNAQDALEYIGTHAVDVLIADIRMPRMSGLELGRIVAESHPGIKIVILSGYSNFSYAQQAISYRVFSYLLKPSRDEQLVKVLGDLKSVLDRESRERRLLSHSGEILRKTAGFEERAGRRADPPGEPCGKPRGRATNAAIRRAIDIVNTRYAEDISLDSLARILQLSPSHLCRLFKSELGCNFKDYLIDVRITMARELLKDGTLKVYEIAERVGYSDPRHFGELFKARTGLTPLEFRNRPA